MPYMCCVAKCPNASLHPGRTNFSFHRFPKDESLSEQWMANINRPHFAATKHTRICSAHFEDWCFQRNDEADVRNSGLPVLRRSLKGIAVPTLFNKMILTRVLHKGGKRGKKKAQEVNGENQTTVPLPPEPYKVAVSITNNNYVVVPDTTTATTNITVAHNGTNGHINGHLGNHALDNPQPLYAASPARGDTYELTELTPMVKRERLSPLPDSYGEQLQFQHRASTEKADTVDTGSISPPSLSLDAPWAARPTTTTATPTSLGRMDGDLNGFSSCLISETFLFTMLRLIKCPHCGYGANPDLMHKYENQGCLLGVRLACYNGHLVIDWMI